nr:DUF429 domain-containing protein [uncultured Pseudodesulfovibrio sp.]
MLVEEYICMMKYVGVDGCKGGWFAVWVTNGGWSFALYDEFVALWDKHKDAEAVLVDIPIGLPETGTRKADVLTRERLGKRKSSVFNTPVRKAVYAGSKREAKLISQKLSGKSLSEQSLGIVKKIYEVDEFLQGNVEARHRVYESHPELCFSQLFGGPMPFPKRDVLGVVDRFVLLEKKVCDLRSLIEAIRLKYRASQVAGDDILDACVLAVTAWKGGGRLRSIPDFPEIDATGLPMAIWHGDFQDRI